MSEKIPLVKTSQISKLLNCHGSSDFGKPPQGFSPRFGLPKTRHHHSQNDVILSSYMEISGTPYLG